MWLGLLAGQRFPPLGEVLTGDGAKSVLQTRGSEGVARVDCRLRARDGIESPVVVAIEWAPGEPSIGRGVLYGLSLIPL